MEEGVLFYRKSNTVRILLTVFREDEVFGGNRPWKKAIADLMFGNRAIAHTGGKGQVKKDLLTQMGERKCLGTSRGEGHSI